MNSSNEGDYLSNTLLWSDKLRAIIKKDGNQLIDKEDLQEE